MMRMNWKEREKAGANVNRTEEAKVEGDTEKLACKVKGQVGRDEGASSFFLLDCSSIDAARQEDEQEGEQEEGEEGSWRPWPVY